MKKMIATILYFLIFAVSVFAETIYLKDGTTIKGEITETLQDSIKVKTKFGEMTIPKSDIDKIEYGEAEVKKVVRGWLGVRMQDIIDKEGALVSEVIAGGPAEKAGIKQGDAIVQFDGKKVQNSSELSSIVGKTPPLQKVPVKVIREGKELTIDVVLGKAPEKEDYEKMVKTQEIDNYTKAIELNPKDADAYYGRGVACIQSNEYQGAIDNFSKAIELDTKYVSAYLGRGLAYYNLGQDQKAIDNYSKAIELNPKDALVYCNRGNIYYRLGQYQKARDDYSKAIELNPKDALAYCNRGDTYYRLRQNQKAIDDYTRAIEINPKYVSAYLGRGATYYYYGPQEKAIDDYNKAIELNPKNAPAYLCRGLVYSALGSSTLACGDFYEAGLLYLNQNQKNKALECVDDMKKADPFSPLIKKLIDKIYE